MKQNLLLIFSILFFGQLSAQNLEFDVSPVITGTVNASDFEGIGHSVITNTAATARSLKWTRSIVEMTEGWNVAVCDKNQCYIPTVTTREFNLEPSEGGTMDVHVYPNGISGSAIIEVLIEDVNDTNLFLSNLYYFNTEPTSTTELNRQIIKVYPNPSNGLFTVKGDKKIGSLDVYSLTGRKVAAFTYGQGQWYNIATLPKGTYLIRLIDRDGQQLVTKLINKM